MPLGSGGFPTPKIMLRTFLLGLMGIAILGLSLISCMSPRTLSDIKQEQKNLLMELQTRTERLDQRTSWKYRRGGIDSTGYRAVTEAVQEIKVQIQKEAEKVERLAENKSHTVKAVIFEQNQVIRCLMNHLDQLNDYLGQQAISEFKTTDIFDTGAYKITEAQQARTRQIAAPVLDQMLRFAQRYGAKKVSAMITISGYADGQPIPTDTPIYALLMEGWDVQNPSPRQLNQRLSQFRADAIGEVIERLMVQRKAAIPDFSEAQTQVLKIGMGEAIPPGVKDPQREDPRRRIVTISWTVVPKIEITHCEVPTKP